MTTVPAEGGPSEAPEAGADRRRGGPPAWFALVAIGGLVLGVIVIVSQMTGIGGAAPPAATIPPTGEAAQRTHDLVTAALGAASFQITDPQTQYHPGESASLIDVPRRVVQAVLPSDPQGGYIVIYELPSNAEADRVGRDFAAYLASGPGAIQYPRDEQFVLRRVGSTLVFFAWSPSVSPDPRVAQLAGVLSGIGEPLSAG